MSGCTRTPWELSRDSSAYMEGTLIIDPIKDVEVAGVWKEEDARHIVHCVNNHDRLIEALRNVKYGLESKLVGSPEFTLESMIEGVERALTELENQQ